MEGWRGTAFIFRALSPPSRALRASPLPSIRPTDRDRHASDAKPAAFFIHLTQIRIWEPGGGLRWRPPDF